MQRLYSKIKVKWIFTVWTPSSDAMRANGTEGLTGSMRLSLLTLFSMARLVKADKPRSSFISFSWVSSGASVDRSPMEAESMLEINAAETNTRTDEKFFIFRVVWWKLKIFAQFFLRESCKFFMSLIRRNLDSAVHTWNRFWEPFFKISYFLVTKAKVIIKFLSEKSLK